MFKARHANFRQGVYVNQLAAILLRSLQRSKHAGMVCAGILTDNKDRLRSIEIFECDRSLPDSNCFVQSRATGFVAHVGAIRKIVCAELTGEELVQKSGFVARPS
jgi:hypothetical protein